MNKRVLKYEDIKDKIYEAVDIITEPIASTLSPKGSNVIYEDNNGNQFYTNDGKTIAMNIQVKDDVHNAIIEIIKGGSLKTNMEVGDGTSSTVVASSILIKEGLRLVENGYNQMDVRDELIKFAETMKVELTKKAIKVKDDKDIKFISKISAGNDEDIANDVVKIMKVVGLDGQVMLDKGYGEKTEIIEDTGFVLHSGLFSQELANKQFQSGMVEVPVLITDKRIYYKPEAETILKTVLDSGYNEVVIIAQDFIGEALPYFVTNHKNNKVRVILISEKRLEVLEDLAIYLGGEVISDKKGSLVDDITIDSFIMAKRVFADPVKAIISRDKEEKNKELPVRIKALRQQMEKNGNKNDPEYIKYQNRISSLTNGMVTVKVGGITPIETIERLYRYEDAINAVRAGMKEGYLPGAGIAIYESYLNIEKSIPNDFKRMFKALAEANIRQIAINCGRTPEVVIEKLNELEDGIGYNAVNGKYENMIKAGVIEPLLVATNVIANAVSIANVIVTSKYLIVNDLEDYKESNKNK